MNKIYTFWTQLKENKLPWFYLFILLGGLVIALILVQNKQLFRSKAAVGNGRIDLPTNISTGINQFFDVPIMINTSGVEVVGADIVLSYDRHYLDINNITPVTQNNPLSKFLPHLSATNILDTNLVIQNARNTGKIEFGAVAYNGTKTVPTLSGVLTPLAYIQFKALKEGTTYINVDSGPGSKSDANLIDKSSGDILGQVINAVVDIAGVAPAFTPTPTFSPTPTVVSGDSDTSIETVTVVDDGYSINSWGHNETNDRVLVGGKYDGGFRFPLNVPANSQIIKATLTANLKFSAGGLPANVNLEAEKTLDAAPLTGYISSTFIPNRTYFPPSIAWKIIGFDLPVTSPDITPLIQEIVNQPGWAPGKNILISLLKNSDNYAQLYSKEGDLNRAAKLSVTYRSVVVRESKTIVVADDGYSINNWGHNATNNWVLAGGRYDAGFRFVLPAKGKIISAKLILPLKFSSGGSTVPVFIEAEHALRAAPLTGTNPFIPNRQYLPGSINWNIKGNNKNITSPDITPLIQEIVNQPGWIPNREILIALKKTGVAASSDGVGNDKIYSQFDSREKDSRKAAKLVVEYEYTP